MGYQAYPDYKESEIEWFGKCPAHWRRHRLKWTVDSLKNGVWGSEPSGEDDLYCIRVADFDRTQLRTSPDNLTLRSVQRKDRTGRLLIKGDLLLEKSGGGDKQLVGALVEYTLDEPAVCSNFVAAISTASNIHSRYLAYLHNHLYSSKVNYRSIKQSTGIQNLDAQMYLDEIVIYPSHNEQEKISAFLDYKTTQLDHLIEKKQELIEKLQEQRISMITTAVTRGVNAQALAGPCVQDWLGSVPEHWEKNHKLKFLSTDDRNSFINGPFGSDLLTSELVNEGVPVIYSGDVKETGFQRKSDKYVTEEKAKQLDFCRVDGGDILLAKVGDPPGDACVYPLDQPSGIVTQDVVRIKVDKRTVDAEYLCFLLNSKYGRHLVRLVSVEATRGRFSLADLKSIRHILPPLEEQQGIVLHIQQQMKRCTRLSDLAIREIEALREYRTALITAAVTGQIDVRDWKAPAAAETSEQDKEVA